MRLKRRMTKLAGYEVDVRNDQDYTEAKSYSEEEQTAWKDAYYLIDRISRLGSGWFAVAEAVKTAMHYYNDGVIARPGSAWGGQDSNLVRPAISMFNKKYSNDPNERIDGDLGYPFQSLVYGLEQNSSGGGIAGLITDWEALLGCIQSINWNKGR
jgi:hypothetical protein